MKVRLLLLLMLEMQLKKNIPKPSLMIMEQTLVTVRKVTLLLF